MKRVSERAGACLACVCGRVCERGKGRKRKRREREREIRGVTNKVKEEIPRERGMKGEGEESVKRGD